jgi:O-acetyl-ADP-ribose deacetylase (regulator of RNase III)
MKYIDGDLLDLAEQGKFDIVVHGVNCQNTMKSGIADQIRTRYPKAYLADQITQKGDLGKLGCFTQAAIDGIRITHPMERFGFKSEQIDEHDSGITKTRYSFTILNAYTQGQYGYEKNAVYVDYDAVARVFKQIKLLYDMNPMAAMKIGIPMIGAGRGGGDWTIIESIIDELNFSDLTCVCFNGGQ